MKDNFIEELRELCNKYNVSLYGNIFLYDEYDRHFVDQITDKRKNLTQPEK